MIEIHEKEIIAGIIELIEEYNTLPVEIDLPNSNLIIRIEVKPKPYRISA